MIFIATSYHASESFVVYLVLLLNNMGTILLFNQYLLIKEKNETDVMWLQYWIHNKSENTAGSDIAINSTRTFVKPGSVFICGYI